VSLAPLCCPNAEQAHQRSGLSDANGTSTTGNTSQVDLTVQTSAQEHPDEDEEEDEPFVYPGSTDDVTETVESEEPPQASASLTLVERDPAQLEEIYAAAVSGDLHLLQTLFQTAVSSETGNTEAFALANDATTRTGLTPLHGAASRGHAEIVQWRECLH
jgi:hypothetical protein